MKSSIQTLLFSFLISVFMVSCIPSRQFDDVKTAKERCETDLAELLAKYETYMAREKELNVRLDGLSKQVQTLSGDTTTMGLTYRRLTSSYDRLNKTYDQLLENNSQLM